MNNESGILTLDVFQKDNEIVVKSAIAGVGGKDLDISITNDSVTIKGTRKEEEKEKGKDYLYQELHWGEFSRKVILPEEVNADAGKATLKNGILTITLPKLRPRG
ncbi:MAG: Hsp20/alpha crystallin family protein [Parcubacteria group bacterium]|nr:Hsp20/alpha crystallin family protein [Parcubacteria group bacterium]